MKERRFSKKLERQIQKRIEKSKRDYHKREQKAEYLFRNN